LDALAHKYAVWLEGADEGALRDICRTSNQGRRHFEHRRALVGDSVKALAAQLRAPALPRSERRRRPRVAFLFPGEGAPLGLDAPAFRAALDECAAILPRFRDGAQTSLFAHQYALARLWMSWGIAPDAVLGDGAGEFAAACIAGDCTLEEGLTAARERRPAPDPQRFADSLRKLRDLDQRIVIDLDSSDGATFVDDLTVLDGARPMETLAVLYEHGFNPDWIAVDGKASKLALPTYPFQREPFWIRHKPQPRSRFHFELSPGDDASLRDHRLNGRVLVPGAAYAVLALEHAHATALRDVRFTRPLSFADGDDPTLHLVLTPRGDFQFADQSLAEYCHGTIDTSRAESTRVSLEELQARHGEECAPEGADAGFAIGPAYQWTRSVRHGAHEVLCELRPATQLTAGLLDACLRTLALCRPDRAAREIEVPVCIGSLRVFGAPRDTTLWCHAEVAGDGGNVRLFDDAGNVLLEVLGLETRRVPIATLIGATTLDDALVKIEWMRVEGQRVDPAANDVVFECAGHDIGPRLLALLKTIDESATLWLVTRNTQAVLPNDPIEPAHAWVWGLGRVLALEHPRLRCIRVDLDDAGALAAIDGESELAIRGGVAYAPRLVPAQMPRETLHLRADATYVITGAFGALGSRVARWMVEQGARNLVLVGRNPSPVELDANIRIVRGDVADPEVVARIGTVDGVIHAAGVLDDGLLRDLTWDRFERVFAPKVRGTRNLDAHTRAMKLDFFVCFSSAASLIGSAGQANYAAANAAMDALIHQRRSLGLPGLSINWGAWAGGGMADTMDARLRALGLAPIDPAAGLELLGRLIASDAAQVGVLPKSAPLVADAMPEQVDTPMMLLQRTPPHDRQRGLELHIRERVISVMGRDPFPASDNDISFFEIGMDSLMSLDLRNRLQTDLDQPLPSTIAFEYPTIPNLAEHLLADILLFDAAR
jgi:acyl transferase domain-containing protein/acyl carrier protein